MKDLLGLDHPFFRPLWRRIAVTAVCLGWGAIEFLAASPVWGALLSVLGLYCAWALLIDYRTDGGKHEQE